MSLHFEWNREKAALNIRNHKVSFDEASTVFDDPLARIFDDADHSIDEHREIINGKIMSKTQVSKNNQETTVDELRTEYRFDYSKGRSNRFAGRSQGEHLVVVLDPDVAEVFKTPESVNEVLRALIETMPPKPEPKVAVG